jgi:DNA-binding transcriptional ArsR family regulator
LNIIEIDNIIEIENDMKREKKPLSRADLIGHPVCHRIIMTVAGRRLTTQEIAAVLPDVPQATLYRNIHRLADAGILEVVKEIPVRGTVERVYALVEGASRIGGAELANASREDHVRFFTVMFASMLSWLRRYLQQETIDPIADGLTCRATTVYLSDAEYHKLLDDLGELMKPAMSNPPTRDRRRRIIGWTAIPERRDPSGRPEKTEE